MKNAAKLCGQYIYDPKQLPLLGHVMSPSKITESTSSYDILQ